MRDDDESDFRNRGYLLALFLGAIFAAVLAFACAGWGSQYLS